MSKWIFFLPLIFLLLCVYSIGQNITDVIINKNIGGKTDTLTETKIHIADSGTLYNLNSLQYILQPVEIKDTNYRELITTLMEKSTLKIRGLYLPGWKIVNRSKIDILIEFMHENHFNHLIFDLKNAHGELFFSSTNEEAINIGSQAKTDEGRPRSIDLDYLKMKAKEKNIKLTGRHVMFRDEVLYNQVPDYRLIAEHNWVDMRNQAVVDYNLALLKEEATFGLDEIAIDYIRFPETNEFGSFGEKNEKIEEIVKKSSDIFKSSNTKFGIFIFGYISWGIDVGIGQTMTGLEGLVDRVYPMIYPSHFASGTLGYSKPNDNPFEIIEKSCQISKELMHDFEKSIPMLQAFWCSQKSLYLQIKAIHDNQMSGFVLWNAQGNYHLYFTY